MDPVARSIALAGLLHDIGKFLQRAEEKLSDQSKSIEGYLCPKDNKGNYTHRHVLWTDHFFIKYLKDNYLEGLIGELNNEAKVSKLASYHHNPDANSPLQKIIQEADHLSSSEREEADYDQSNSAKYYKSRRLFPIFERLKLTESDDSNSDNKQFKSKYRYPLKQLSIKDNIFPSKDLNDNGLLVNEYKLLWEGNSNKNTLFFKFELNILQNKINSSPDNFNLFYNALYHLLEKYIWCIPSFTQSDCDISLFDHMRTTSAIALCLYLARENYSDEKFMLIHGDLSGIQNFIYRLAQPSNVKQFAKILRGRSFYLSILPWILSFHIANELELTVSNILWCSGGNFTILSPNTKSIKDKLEKIKKDINNWFLDQFQGSLGIIIGQVDATPDDIKDFGSLYEKLIRESSKLKKQKFLEILKENNIYQLPTNKPSCKVCDIFEIKEDEIKDNTICSVCELHRQIGHFIPKTDYLVFARQPIIIEKYNSKFSINFGKFGQLYLTDNSEYNQFLNKKDINAILGINNTDCSLGFIFIAKEVPLSKIENKIQELDKGDVLPFNYLGKMAQGDNRLAALKMDIDNLGAIFSIGLIPQLRSISRIATVSRMLDYFFCGYFNTIAGQMPLQNSVEYADSYIYTVYSGGDDLLAIGPWDKVINFTREVNASFREFVAENPDITVSAGIYMFKTKFPVTRASKLADEELKKAKIDKNQIVLFNTATPWYSKNGIPDLNDCIKKAEEYTKYIKSKEIPRSLLHRILELRKRYIDKNNKNINSNYIPLLLYSICRNIRNEDLKIKLIDYYIRHKNAENNLFYVVVPITIALLNTRDRRHDYEE